MNKQKTPILVTGGAGYIGSHTVRMLLKKNFLVVILDNLINGNKEFVPKEAIFIQGDLGDKKLLNKLFKKFKFKGVIHFAAFAYVRESLENPLRYFQNNIRNGIVLLEAMLRNNVKNIVFSSSCAIYGIPKKIPITEKEKKDPLSPYGRSKLFFEKMLFDLDEAYGMKHVCLRYFNAAGAMPDKSLGEKHLPETHIIPLILKSIKQGKKFHIFGNDFPTKDKTCIRDYIHVCDLAYAHVKAIEYLIKKNKSIQVNLGTGKGTSIMELIKLIEKVTNKKLDYDFSPKCEGDAPELVADPTKAKKILNWKPKYSIKDIIKHAWEWEKIVDSKK